MEIPDQLIKNIDASVCHRVLSMLKLARGGCMSVQDTDLGHELVMDCQDYEKILCLVSYCFIASSELRAKEEEKDDNR